MQHRPIFSTIQLIGYEVAEENIIPARSEPDQRRRHRCRPPEQVTTDQWNLVLAEFGKIRRVTIATGNGYIH
jgi:hypothetical protein